MHSSFAQSNKTLLKHGSEAYDKGDFYTASVYFQQLVSKDSLDKVNVLKLADAYRYINDYEKALNYYSLLYKLDRGREYPEAVFWEAMMAKQTGDYKLAKRSFRKATTKFRKQKDSYIFLKATHEQNSVDWAIRNIKTKTSNSANIEHLPSLVNGVESEFAASAIDIDSTIFFTSLKFYSDTSDIFNSKTAIYKSKKDENGDFQEAERWIFLNDSTKNTANLSFLKDSTWVVFNYCDEKRICEIWYAKFEPDGIISTPKKADKKINLEGFTASQPSLTRIDNDLILLFASNRPGGKGNLDIWWAKVEEKEKENELIFQEAKNAGDSINSIDNEVSPFYDAISNALYFSSQWHENFGGFDIFKSEGALDSLKKPENMGKEFNTFANDFYFNIVETKLLEDYLAKSKGYFVSNREGSFTNKNSTCCNDIYAFEYQYFLIPPKEKEKTKEEVKFETLAQLNDYLPLTLYFHNDEPNPRTRDTTTNFNYLQTYKSYVKLTEKYKKEYSSGLEKEAAEKAQQQIEDFFEDYVNQGVDYLEDFTVLLLEALQKGMHIDLYVKGYASPLAQSDYNLLLTKRRIASLHNYLKEYENGVFIPYFNNEEDNSKGKLKFLPQPFGSLKAEKNVSDNYHDQRNSVYSMAAALERKIEIIAIEVDYEEEEATENQELFEVEDETKIELEKSLYDYGKILYGQKVAHTFSFQNTGSHPLIIKDIQTSCGCTLAEIEEKIIQPNEFGKITVNFDSEGKFGPQNSEVLIFTNTPDSPIRLVLKGNVVMENN